MEEIANIQNVVAYINPEMCERPDIESEIQIATTTKTMMWRVQKNIQLSRKDIFANY